MNLLLIDDDKIDRLNIIRVLKQSNQVIEFVESATAQEGITQAHLSNFDLILLDFHLPDMNALEALKLLNDGENNRTAVIILSQKDDNDLALKCIEAGAQDYIKKNEITVSRLMSAILHSKQRYQIEQELRESHEQLRLLAEVDTLTGLANRYHFDEALKNAIPMAKRLNKGLALVMLDLDKFKNVNDTLGHIAGDTLLQEVARRLRLPVRDEDILCRLGGDEFAILIQSLTKAADVQKLIDRIFNALRAPFNLEGRDFIISASMGVATFPACGTEPNELMKSADVAMYRSKEAGRNQSHFYSQEVHQEVSRRVYIEQAMHTAIEKNELEVYYQPQVDYKGKKLVGVEALVRWHHPTLGTIPPLEFIPLAEDIGTIDQIGQWVLKTACKQYSSWSDSAKLNEIPLAIAVNLSPTQLNQRDFLACIKSTLAECKISANNLELELTESTINKSVEAGQLLNELTELGVKLALDDFGTGYSSLMQLQKYPFKILKIDKSFIKNIVSKKDSKFLAAIHAFAKTLDFEIVAEGVETEYQFKICQELKLERIQGFYFAKAMPANEFQAQWLS
jgi:diguanylate cyclase (GGDEF)-like protein